jgi:hypothetical protein
MSLDHTGETRPFCSPQDEIQWGILFLTRQLRNISQRERERCLQEVWEWARRRADLLCLQMIRDYRECLRANGSTYIRHRAWFWRNRNNPEFWLEWERRFPKVEPTNSANILQTKLGMHSAEIRKKRQ